jgi:maltose O-acetyltransferase
LISDSTLTVVGKAKKNVPVFCVGKGKIIFKKNNTLGYFPSPHFFDGYIHLEAREPESRIIIGENTWISNNAIMISNNAGIEIGNNCLIGYNCEFMDSDFHGLYRNGKNEKIISKQVIIGDNVFISANCKILKGAKIGNNSIIGMDTVVRGKVPENVIFAGNPGQIITHL